MSLHVIQKQVLKALCMNRSLAYSQLKPAHIEGNQFSYHLKSLIKKGYVLKKDSGYALSTKGVRHCTNVNLEHFFVRIQPKIVTLLVCKNSRGHYAVYTRNKLPFLGMIGFPYGKIHLGEQIQKAAERELKEKTGLSGTLIQKGIAYLLTTDPKNEVISHTLAHVFLVTTPKGALLQDPPFGKVRWISETELLKENTMPGVNEVLQIAKRPGKGLVFEEYEFQQA